LQSLYYPALIQNMKIPAINVLFCLFLAASTTQAAGFTHAEIDYQLCFTPPENCTSLIVDTINSAKNTIYVQAYSFTSSPIMRALLTAKNRGVDVNILLDKSQVNANQYSAATFFVNHQIPVWIDYKPEIAHNKVMIIDNATVITGSFNFTKAAQFQNAENLLIIKNDEIAKKYLTNWQERYQESSTIAALPVAKFVRARTHGFYKKRYYKKTMAMIRKRMKTTQLTDIP